MDTPMDRYPTAAFCHLFILLPGCNGTNLNSRTYNIVLESDAFTCQHHRTIRELERQFIKSLPTIVSTKKPILQPVPTSGNSAGTDVYDFTSESDNGEVKWNLSFPIGF